MSPPRPGGGGWYHMKLNETLWKIDFWHISPTMNITAWVNLDFPKIFVLNLPLDYTIFHLFFIDAAEVIFVSIFSVEVLIKLFAFGIVGYCNSLFNVFDLVVSFMVLLFHFDSHPSNKLNNWEGWRIFEKKLKRFFWFSWEFWPFSVSLINFFASDLKSTKSQKFLPAKVYSNKVPLHLLTISYFRWWSSV